MLRIVTQKSIYSIESIYSIMTTKAVRITIENLKFLESIDEDLNNAILILKHEKRMKDHFDLLTEGIKQIKHKLII